MPQGPAFLGPAVVKSSAPITSQSGGKSITDDGEEVEYLFELSEMFPLQNAPCNWYPSRPVFTDFLAN